MEKKTEKKNRISGYDRLQALKLIPQFLSELAAVDKSKGFSYSKIRAFKKRYGFSPEDATVEKDFQGEKSFLKLFPNGSTAESLITEYLDPPLVEVLRVFEEQIRDDLIDDCLIQQGRFATLRVDLLGNKDDLKKELLKEIEKLKAKVTVKTGPRSPRTINDLNVTKWDIYRMHHCPHCHLKFPEIARLISGESGSTAYNDELRRVEKAVKRAYDNAVLILNQVKQETFS